MNDGGIYSTYDDFYRTHLSSIQLGGLNRAKTAKRDKWGRFMSNDDTVSLLPEPDRRTAGLKRVAQAKRDTKGRFIKS